MTSAPRDRTRPRRARRRAFLACGAALLAACAAPAAPEPDLTPAARALRDLRAIFGEGVLGDGTPVFGGAVEFLSTESLWLPMPAGAAGDEVCLHGRSLDATGHWAEGPESCVEIEPHPICGLRGDPAVGAAAFALAATFVARRRSRGR